MKCHHRNCRINKTNNQRLQQYLVKTFRIRYFRKSVKSIIAPSFNFSVHQIIVKNVPTYSLKIREIGMNFSLVLSS